MRPLQHKCPTLRGDKDDRERRQTITCHKFHPNTGYLFHLMYAYITQGRPDRGLLRLTPRAQAIITQGIGVYAAPLQQPTQITARTAQGNPIYVYHPTAIARLPIPSDTDIIYFTDASGTQQRTPTVENLPRNIPTRNPHHVYTPSTEHSTGTAHTGTTGTAHTSTSMRAPPAPIPPRRRPSTGTTNRQPPHVPSAFASGYHRQPCPAIQTTGSAWEPRTASPTASTAGTSTPTTASGPRPQQHPPPPATPASSGSSPTPSGTTWEGTTWLTRRTTHGP